jgi:hypothetical protein
MIKRDRFYRELIVIIDHFSYISFHCVKDDLEAWCGLRMFELDSDDLVKATMAVNVQIIRSPCKVHGEDQSNKSKVMITV